MYYQKYRSKASNIGGVQTDFIPTQLLIIYENYDYDINQLKFDKINANNSIYFV